MRIKVFSIVTFAALATGPALADTTIKMDQVMGGSPGTATMYIHDGVIRVDNSAMGAYVLFNTKTETMTSVQPAEQRYTVMDTADLARAGAAMQDAMAQMEAQLAQLPPEARERMREMLGERMAGMMQQNKSPAAEPTVTATGEQKTFNGHSCEVNRIESPQINGTVCLAPYEELGIPSDDYQTITAMQEMTKAMAESMGQNIPGAQSWLDGGFAVHFDQSAMGTNVQGTLTSVSTGSLDADMFTVPAGFEEQAMPSLN